MNLLHIDGLFARSHLRHPVRMNYSLIKNGYSGQFNYSMRMDSLKKRLWDNGLIVIP